MARTGSYHGTNRANRQFAWLVDPKTRFRTLERNQALNPGWRLLHIGVRISFRLVSPPERNTAQLRSSPPLVDTEPSEEFRCDGIG